MSCKKCKTSKCTCETNICINPLIYTMKNVFSLVETDSQTTAVATLLATITKDGSPPLPVGDFILDLPEAVIQALLGGISISNNNSYCCPDCKSGIYFLGNAARFSELIAANQKFCCVEHYSSTAIWNQILTELIAADGVPPCCNTDFSEAVENWIAVSNTSNALFYLEDLNEKGLIESSSFNGYSGLGIMFNYLQLSHPELTAEDYLNIISVIANIGLVVRCVGCEMIIADVDTYITWVNTTP